MEKVYILNIRKHNGEICPFEAFETRERAEAEGRMIHYMITELENPVIREAGMGEPSGGHYTTASPHCAQVIIDGYPIDLVTEASFAPTEPSDYYDPTCALADFERGF